MPIIHPGKPQILREMAQSLEGARDRIYGVGIDCSARRPLAGLGHVPRKSTSRTVSRQHE